MAKFQVFITYSQLSVFDASLSNPFNNWTPSHVEQGFAWRPRSVSFKTLSEAGKHNVELLVAHTEVPVLPSAVRVIEVPFLVPANGLIEVGSISDGQQLSVASGSYGLRFEALAKLEIRLVLTMGKEPGFFILRADSDLSPAFPLLETAEPA